MALYGRDENASRNSELAGMGQRYDRKGVGSGRKTSSEARGCSRLTLASTR